MRSFGQAACEAHEYRGAWELCNEQQKRAWDSVADAVVAAFVTHMAAQAVEDAIKKRLKIGAKALR